MSWQQFAKIASLGFCSGFFLGLCTLVVHVVRTSTTRILRQVERAF